MISPRRGTRLRRHRRVCRAFTLIELALATAILAIVGAAVSSVLMVAARSAPPASGGSASAVELADILSLMSIEVGLATEIIAAESDFVSFVGPDADGDGIGDDIGYAFSSTSGGQIYRAVNSNPSVVFTGVGSMEFSYLTDTVTVRGATSTVVRAVNVTIKPTDSVTLRRTVRCVGLPPYP